ncbi:hypothetical protein FBY35_3643 [Streptomyces sp. SLBN-118]|nr:hypothetical protein [Streptomyces sp. SLBN-118]TQK53164.1 hypothetical protein FBY35_3643 [Streptomyces sp. SLBN-118]
MACIRTARTLAVGARNNTTASGSGLTVTDQSHAAVNFAGL